MRWLVSSWIAVNSTRNFLHLNPYLLRYIYIVGSTSTARSWSFTQTFLNILYDSELAFGRSPRELLFSRTESEVSNATPLNKSAWPPVPTEMPEICHVIRQQRVQPVMRAYLYSDIFTVVAENRPPERVPTRDGSPLDISPPSETDSRPIFPSRFFSFSVSVSPLLFLSSFSFFFLFSTLTIFLAFIYLQQGNRRYLDTT